MKISYNWLKDYINPIPSPEKTAEILTNIGLEVEALEEYESIKGGLKGVVIGEVLTCSKHPNADKLSLTSVSIGKEKTLRIVCGAPNIAIGQKVAVATIGTTLFKGAESFTLEKTKIRGEISEGMICAEDELGLGTSHDGIMVLDPSAKPGTSAGEYFDISSDHVFEIGLTPNRVDAASHFGVARDLAAYLGKNKNIRLIKPSVDSFKPDSHKNSIPVEIADKEGCFRYSGLSISGVTVKESPGWLKKKLQAVGLNPINNIVDITNFVMYETGQPLHAFDADKIKGNKVIVRTLPEGSVFKALDGKEIILGSEDLMICDTQEGMCIAGVFGGLESGVKSDTKNIFLESACFNPLFIRKTSRKHLLNTDSSFRFERGTDPNNTIYALKRAAMLIKELAGGEFSSELIDVYPKHIVNPIVSLSYKNLDRLIGQKIERRLVKSILQSLDIKVISENRAILKLEIPTYRVDVLREADVIEEVLRIYGYNNINISKNLTASLSFTHKPDKEAIWNMISELLSSNGFLEIMCNSLTKSSYYKNDQETNDKLVRIYNPLSSDLDSMRQTLLYGGLESVLYNANRKNLNLRMYEFGNIYLKFDRKTDNPLDDYFEEERLALVITGNKNEANWNTPAGKSNFFQLKAYTELVLEKLGFDIDQLKKCKTRNHYLSEGLDYLIHGKSLVSFGKVKKNLCREFDIKNEVFFSEFSWTEILKNITVHETRFRDLPKYPEVKRDLSMMLERSVSFEQIKAVSKKAGKELLREIILFDVYEGDKIQEGKKSYAVSYILRDDNKTLTDEEIYRIMNSIGVSLEKELGAQIRSGNEPD